MKQNGKPLTSVESGEWAMCFCFIIIIILSKFYAQGGAWTHDPENKRHMLYVVSQPGAILCNYLFIYLLIFILFFFNM